MLKLFCLCLILAAAIAKPLNDEFGKEFEQFKQKYGKTYSSKIEEEFRKKIFYDTSYKINRHNNLYNRNLTTFTMAINRFSDLLNYEFVEMMNGFDVKKTSKGEGSTFIKPHFLMTPDSIDWRTKGYVTSIKDQGQCGSCYAFSATGSLEGQHFRKTSKLVSLSEQNILDCSSAFGNAGCDGGLMNYSFQYIKSNGGIDTEESYPYEEAGDKCRFNKSNIGATLTGFVNIETGVESDLQAAVASVGPISIAIDASRDSFQSYSSGVYYEPLCTNVAALLDHGVLAVGYGTDPVGGDFWQVKNSWGNDWGEKGYIRMARNKDNQCGVATAATYPLV